MQGKTPYSEAELRVILSSCGQTTVATTLNACASALTARLIKDGYINSRVFTNADPAPGALDVVLGTIAELRIDSEDTGLKNNVQQQLQPLIGTVLHPPDPGGSTGAGASQWRGVDQGSMGRLGSDPTKAVISLNVEQAPPTPLQGEVELSNTGNTGSGEWRGIATVLQNNLLRQGDTGLLFLELDTDGQLELGTAVLSGTYTWPLSPRWSLTGSLGSSYRRFVEFQKPAYNFSFRTLQGLFSSKPCCIRRLPSSGMPQPASVPTGTTATNPAGVPACRLSREELTSGLPQQLGQLDAERLPETWNPRLRISGNAFWSSNLFFLQGCRIHPGQAPEQSDRWARTGDRTSPGRPGRPELAPVGDHQRESACWGRSRSTHCCMGFILGSDAGLKGLPGTIISGDSG